jgi:hypothetical protein
MILGNRVCGTCRKEYSPTSPRQVFCPPCGRANELERKRFYMGSHRVDRRVAHRKSIRKSGLSDKQIDSLLESGCSICHDVFTTTPHIDHDHFICRGKNHVCSKCFRGLLCSTCNTGFIRAIENCPSLRAHVSEHVLRYIDRLRGNLCGVEGARPAIAS